MDRLELKPAGVMLWAGRRDQTRHVLLIIRNGRRITTAKCAIHAISVAAAHAAIIISATVATTSIAVAGLPDDRILKLTVTQP